MNATVFGALRRRLLAEGMSRWPVCPECRVQRDPKDFVAGGRCWGCAQDAKAKMEARDAALGTPNPPPGATYDPD